MSSTKAELQQTKKCLIFNKSFFEPKNCPFYIDRCKRGQQNFLCTATLARTKIALFFSNPTCGDFWSCACYHPTLPEAPDLTSYTYGCLTETPDSIWNPYILPETNSSIRTKFAEQCL